jgi:lipoprotein-anchoring transpeptidase ErfK/SrfK
MMHLQQQKQSPTTRPQKQRSFGHLLGLALFLATLALTLGTGEACYLGPEEPTPTPTLVPTQIPTPVPPPLTPTPIPTPLPQLQPGEAIIVGGDVRTRPEPSTRNIPVGTLPDMEPVRVAAVVQGENWLVGEQTWVPTSPPWASEWYQLDDGTYVYGAFVFQLREGETSPFLHFDGEEKWIDLDLSEQTVRAMAGERPVHVAAATTGAPGFETPQGTHYVEPDGRIVVERMTASQAGYDASQVRYDVERVLFTQYFDRLGNALHLNYWRPDSVFGVAPTSHGCAGLRLRDAQYLWLFAQPGTRVEIHD